MVEQGILPVPDVGVPEKVVEYCSVVLPVDVGGHPVPPGLDLGLGLGLGCPRAKLGPGVVVFSSSSKDHF